MTITVTHSTVADASFSATGAAAWDATHSFTGILDVANGGTGTATPALVAGTNVTITGTWPNQTIAASGGGGSGTVTSVSVVSANGFAGTVATSTTTPAITVSTSITGVLKGNGTAISAASAGTDYQAPITLTTTGTSGAATFVANTLNIPQYSGGGSGTVTSVDATVPAFLSVSGGPITTSGTLAISYSGTALPIANGGTGQTTRQAAINALVDDLRNTRFLRANGTNATMSTIQVTDVPTLNQDTTGTAANVTATTNSTLTTLSALSLPGSQVSGNISGNAANVTGTVAIANGGTGQTTASAGFNALSPVTTTGDLILGNGANSATRLPIGTDGQILTSNGSTAAWGSKINSATAVASTSGTSIDFTNIPSWVKRITLMFSGVSTNGTNLINVQLGTGAGPTFVTTGYNSPFMTTAASSMNTQLATSGFSVINPSAAASLHSGTFVLTNLSGNTWTGFGSCGTTSGTRMFLTSGAIALGAALTAVRISTADTFDAGSINILYE
jgi:hypothetical protein